MTKRPTPPNITPLVEDSSQSPFMRELLEVGRGATVAGYDFEQGLSKHLALIDAGAPLPQWAEGLRPAAGAGGGAAAAAAGSSLIAWIAVPLALVALSSAVILVTKQSPPASVAPAPSALPPTAKAPVAPAPAPAVAPQAAVAPIVVPEQVLRPARPMTNVAPRSAHAKRAAAPLVASKSVSGPIAASKTVAVESTKSAAPATSGDVFATAQPAGAPASSAQPAPAAQPQAKPEPQAAARQPVPPQPPVQDDARLEREMSMLAVAQRALQNDPERALSLARQGESEFAGSMFTQERQQVVLLALVKLGRMDEARRLAKPYLARYPHGPFSERVRHALATGKVER
jgi:hypothetical protein